MPRGGVRSQSALLGGDLRPWRAYLVRLLAKEMLSESWIPPTAEYRVVRQRRREAVEMVLKPGASGTGTATNPSRPRRNST
jgi:hypothetical protein